MPGKYRDISRYLGLKVQANIVFRYRDIYTKGKWLAHGLLGRANVLADLGPRHGSALIEWMQGPGAGLQHSPDLVLTGLDGPGTYRIVEVKTIDVTGPSHIQRHHACRASLRLSHPNVLRPAE